MTITCFHCGGVLSLPDGPVGRSETCSSCRSDVRVCKNCEHYDAKCYNECREPQAERVVEKDRRNFCDYFKPGAGARAAGTSKEDIISALDSLFKPKS